MSNIDLSLHEKSQIAVIICAEEPNIFLDFVPVQEQHSHRDCSIFTIAFGTSLCAGHIRSNNYSPMYTSMFRRKSLQNSHIYSEKKIGQLLS